MVTRICTKCGVSKALETEFTKHPRYKGGYKAQCKECIREAGRDYAKTDEAKKRVKDFVKKRRVNNPEYELFHYAKRRATRKSLPFNISVEDIIIPTHCPVLGIWLERSTGIVSDNSPSVDRKIPVLGYVQGNVRVISQRANRIKYNATAEELRLVTIDSEQIELQKVA